MLATRVEMRFHSRRGTLRDLAARAMIGRWAEVIDVNGGSGGGDASDGADGTGAAGQAAAFGLRLLEMGLVPGTRLRVVRRAPWGCPLQVELRGYHLSLRETEAQAVVVQWPVLASDSGEVGVEAAS